MVYILEEGLYPQIYVCIFTEKYFKTICTLAAATFSGCIYCHQSTLSFCNTLLCRRHMKPFSLVIKSFSAVCLGKSQLGDALVVCTLCSSKFPSCHETYMGSNSSHIPLFCMRTLVLLYCKRNSDSTSKTVTEDGFSFQFIYFHASPLNNAWSVNQSPAA